MGDFPTHEHDITHDGEALRVISPTSILDCDQTECRRQADLARRGTYYSHESIKARLADAHQLLQSAMEGVQLWELVLEAKERELAAPYRKENP